MNDAMYKPEWWDLTKEERYEGMHNYDFCITNEEPIFDAADMMRVGKDVFVQLPRLPPSTAPPARATCWPPSATS